jgi:hypothetical protein
MPPPSGLGALEIAAVILLLIGGFLAGIGWVIGVVLLWISPRWRLSDKLLGTLIWPGGLAGVFVVFGGAALLATSTSAGPCASAAGFGQSAAMSCAQTSTISGVGVVVLAVAVLAGLGGPVLVAIRLVRQARREQQAYAATA